MPAEPDKDGTAPAPRPIVIVRRRKSARGGHHGGAWKVAYADFVTAMMALFIVLWLMSSDKEIKESISAYFSNPTGVGKEVGNASGSGSLDLAEEDMAKLREKLEQVL